ncbi:MAG: glycosyltransferase family 4 protein [Bacteroidota bacterium]
MRVLHISSPRTWRGGEQQIAYLLEEFRAQGIEQWVACPVGSALATYCNKHQFPTVLYKKRFSVNPAVGQKIAQFCRLQSIDILHAHDSHAHTFGVMANAFFGAKPALVVHRRVDFSIGKSLLSNWKYNHPSVNLIICVSKMIESMVQEGLNRAIPTRVIYSGVHLDRFETDSQHSIREELGLEQHTILVGNVAALAPHKDYPTFIRTANLLLEQGQDLQFLLIGGDGGETERIKELIGASRHPKRFHVLGFREDIPSLLPQLNVFLFTSETEGLGTSVIDAFLAKVPVVATRTGGVPELVQHEQNGLLASVKDYHRLAQLVTQTLSDQQATLQRTQKAFEGAQSFGKAQMAQQILNAYQSIPLRW